MSRGKSSNRQSSPQNPYQVLGLSVQSSDTDIKQAYRKLARQYHPDMNDLGPASTLKFQQIQKAYEQIRQDRRQIRPLMPTADALSREEFKRMAEPVFSKFVIHTANKEGLDIQQLMKDPSEFEQYRAQLFPKFLTELRERARKNIS